LKSTSPVERVEKLETAVRAALRLRRAIEDVSPILQTLAVPRAAVEQFDAIMLQLRKEKGK
jgi:hypothetical protein